MGLGHTERGTDSQAFTCRQNHNSLGKMDNNPVPIVNVLVYEKAVFSYTIPIRVHCYLLSLSCANPKEGHKNGERRQEKEP